MLSQYLRASFLTIQQLFQKTDHGEGEKGKRKSFSKPLDLSMMACVNYRRQQKEGLNIYDFINGP